MATTDSKDVGGPRINRGPTVKTGFENATANAKAQYEQLKAGLESVATPPQETNKSKRPGAWVFSTAETGSAFEWACNPSDVSWSMAQRSTHVKNMLGTVLHVWPDSGRKTFYDEYILSMRFQSGNIIPLTDNKGSTYSIKPGLDNFYKFLQLVDAPKLTAAGLINLVEINYTSNIFGEITLRGMFDSKGISFTDDSSSPNQINSWTADFIVYDTVPRFSNNELVISNLLSEQYKKTRLNDPSLRRR